MTQGPSDDVDRTSQRRRRTEYVLLVVWLCTATAVVTWPHARVFTSHVVSHIDPLFSMWRLGWFAHAIAAGRPLLHANIFHPEPFTFLLSDATLLQGALAAPALWSGVPLPIAYNTLLLLGIVSSGLAMYASATRLGVSRAPSVVAATVFSLAPYRVEHIFHLELQWAAFGVYALGMLYSVLYAPRWQAGVALGFAVWLQFVASVYYGVFVLPLLAVLFLVSLPTLPDLWRTLRMGALAAAIAAALTGPVALVYVQQSQRVGERPMSDIATYSATPGSYLASPETNVLYGGTADRFGSGEKRLFPGIAALAFAGVGLFSARRRVAVASLIVVVVSVDLSFGVNGLLYPRLLDWWPFLQGLRAPARYGVFVLAGIAMLAALGVEWILRRARSARAASAALVSLVLALACVEYLSPQRNLVRVDMDPPVYQWLRQLPDAVILELPLPTAIGDAALEADYAYWSTRHWRKLVNGYSGYTPASYGPMLHRLAWLPSADSLTLLRERQVRYILVHLTYYKPDQGEALIEAMLARPELRSLGAFKDWAGPTAVFELVQ